MSGPAIECFWLTLLIVARLVPIALIAPLFGGRWLGASVRIPFAIAAAVTVLASAFAASGSDVITVPGGRCAAAITSLSRDAQLAFIALEVLRGVVIGFAVALVFAGVRSGFRLSLATSGGWPVQTERAASVDALAALIGVACFFAIDGHHDVLRALADSYRHWPLAPWTGRADGNLASAELAWSGLDRARLLTALPEESARVLTVALAIAAPVLVVALALEIGAGLWQRASVRVRASGLPHLAHRWVGTFALSLALLAMAAYVTRVLAAIPETLMWMFE